VSGWTIAQLLAIPVDEVPIQEPVEGLVKLAKDVTTLEEYGESQFFVLEDATGEVGVMWSVAKPTDNLDEVKKGDRVRIQATEYKNKLTGAKKQVYVKDGQKKASIKVSGNRLTNLSRSPEAPATHVQTPQGATSPPTPPHALLSEAEAVETYWRVFERQAAKLSRFVQCEDFEGFMRMGDTHLCHLSTSEVFRGILAGRIAPDARREPPKPQQQQSQPREDDPFEGLDDDPIPF
jgi:single-stranded DNA-binding protein